MKVVDSSSVQRTTMSRIAVDGSGVRRTILSRSVIDSSGIRHDSFVGGMSVGVSSPFSDGYGYSHAPIQITTPPVGVTVTGGTPPYTYSWGATLGTFAAVSPTLATTTFRSPPLSGGASDSGTFVCTVTDAASNTADSPEVSVSATNNGP